MGCIYSDREGECDINEELGNGICVYEDDPNPADSCQHYESDWVCGDCGNDMNVEECECDQY
jgi:hypothetical protein